MLGLVTTLIEIVLAVIEFLLSLRFIFRFFGANFSFANWIYSLSASLVSPFSGFIPNFKLGPFLVDLSILLALIVYLAVGKFIVKLFGKLA